ncbi:MAG: hypothetical protein RL885_28730 [Planctomycetota bacterium]
MDAKKAEQLLREFVARTPPEWSLFLITYCSEGGNIGRTAIRLGLSLAAAQERLDELMQKCDREFPTIELAITSLEPPNGLLEKISRNLAKKGSPRS